MTTLTNSGTRDYKFPKSPTGISGLDEITDGGIPKYRTTLLVGNSGSGKTIIACHPRSDYESDD